MKLQGVEARAPLTADRQWWLANSPGLHQFIGEGSLGARL
jgi:hypothetical protein